MYGTDGVAGEVRAKDRCACDRGRGQGIDRLRLVALQELLHSSSSGRFV
jgi:hypothetical protein